MFLLDLFLVLLSISLTFIWTFVYAQYAANDVGDFAWDKVYSADFFMDAFHGTPTDAVAQYSMWSFPFVMIFFHLFSGITYCSILGQ